MLDGSEIDSNSRFDGKDSQKNTILGKMPTTSTLMMDPNSYKRETTTSISKTISIADTLTLRNEPTLLLSADNQPEDGGCAVSP